MSEFQEQSRAEVKAGRPPLLRISAPTILYTHSQVFVWLDDRDRLRSSTDEPVDSRLVAASVSDSMTSLVLANRRTASAVVARLKEDSRLKPLHTYRPLLLAKIVNTLVGLPVSGAVVRLDRALAAKFHSPERAPTIRRWSEWLQCDTLEEMYDKTLERDYLGHDDAEKLATGMLKSHNETKLLDALRGGSRNGIESFSHAMRLANIWSGVLSLDPAYTPVSVASGDTAMASEFRAYKGEILADLSTPCKLRAGPVYVRAGSSVYAGAIDSIDFDAKRGVLVAHLQMGTAKKVSGQVIQAFTPSVAESAVEAVISPLPYIGAVRGGPGQRKSPAPGPDVERKPARTVPPYVVLAANSLRPN